MKRPLSPVKALLAERSLRRFLLVGLGNTALSLFLQFTLYAAGLGYWGSSALAFCVASLSSFYFNRRYSFQSAGGLVEDALRFSVNIAVCYLLAYGAARPLVLWGTARLWSGRLAAYHGSLSLLFGNGLFTCLNYFGQRFFAFPKRR